MKHNATRGVEKYRRAYQRKRHWREIMTALACIVVFCTVYSLILPAVTWESSDSLNATVLTEEEQERVNYVIALIDAIPSNDEIEQTSAEFEEAEDGDGLENYLSGVFPRVRAAYQAYSALSDVEKANVTNAEKLLELEWIWSAAAFAEFPALTDDSARVKAISVSSIADGVEPFDDNNNAGNDSGGDNRIVRTFDTVTYRFKVDMESHSTTSYSEARVKIEFVLPLTSDQAVFDQSAMGWMDQTSGYAPALTEETRIINGVDTECQVLTCYKQLLTSEGNSSVIPGYFTENLTVNVKSMENGDTFAPVISAAMEHGTWDGGCPTHAVAEKQTVQAEEVKVSAAPKYNVQIAGAYSYKSTFDFNSGWRSKFDYVDGYGIGNVTGRVIKLGITVQLYNDNPSKGFKGIELPDGSPITFDLVTASEYTINTPLEDSEYSAGDKVDVTYSYTPRLWSCDYNSWTNPNQTNTDGRYVSGDSAGCAYEYAPWSSGSVAYNTDNNTACYHGGNWTAAQHGDTITVTVSDYEIDVDQMPTQNGVGNGNILYGKDKGVGCFTSGELWIVQPYNLVKTETSGNAYSFDIVKDYGEGLFTTNVKAVNMKATTISGTSFQDPDGTNTAQTNTNDDWFSQSSELVWGAVMQNRVLYTSEPVFTGKGVGIDDSSNGQDYAAPGTKLYFRGGFSYRANGEDDNILYWGTNLTKFYGSAFELTGDFNSTFNNVNPEPASPTVLYATKKDGTDWADDYELQHTYEDDMVFYKSLSDIPKGDLCVGVLFCYTGSGSAWDNDAYYTAVVGAKVREDSELYGKTFMLASTSRAWTKSMFYNAGMIQNDIPDWTNSATKLSDFPEEAYVSANIEGSYYDGTSYWYVKAVYAEDGSGLLSDHNSEWSHWGDTLLVVGYKASVTKNLLQKTSDSATKETFYLDANQRIVDFKLQPKVSFESSSENLNIKTTVTVIDTLPKYLTYHAGSSYFGGSYVQTSANGGTQGTITGGTLREPDSVTNNSDGTQTLKWIITDVVVGENMPAIYYSADIGNRNNTEEDVPIDTTHLLNTVRITATGDLRQPSLENGNLAEVGLYATRGSAVSFGKYSKQTLVEQNGVIEYVVYFDNNDASGADVMLLDAMPFNSPNGSSFSGTYSLNSCTLDIAKCNKSGLTVYYTTDVEYADATITSLGGTEAAKTVISSWTAAAIGDDGSVDMDQTPIAWAVIGRLDANKSVNFNLQIQLEPAQPSGSDSIEINRYVNTLSCGETVITTENSTVNRTLEGLAWIDGNTDGVQNDSEASLSGVKVSLLKLKDGGDSAVESDYKLYYYSDGTRAVTYTDENGGYKFTNLPAGTYAVKFEDGTNPISQYIASPIGRGDDTKDSDGVAIYSSDKSQLNRTVILGIEMPAAKDMSVVLLESKYHDSGFYERGYELPKSGGSGTALYTAVGSVMIFVAATLLYIKRINKKV